MNTAMQVEVLRLMEQQRLDASLSSTERNKSGRFATPPSLAEQITRHALSLFEQRHNEQQISFLEPSIGTGAFYSALLRTVGTSAIDNAVGIELDPITAQTAAQLWNPFGLAVHEADFTNIDLDPAFNLILANPPYVRHHHLSIQQKAALRRSIQSMLGYTVNGLAGLYCYFVLLADRYLVQDGLAAWLIPSEFMDVNYGEVLRRYFTESVTLLHVHRFRPADTQFEDALVSSAVVIYEKRRSTPEHIVHFTLGGTLDEPENRAGIKVAQLRDSQKWSRFPVNSSVITAPSQKPIYLEDIFAIKRGIATGANDFFVLRRDEAKDQGLPEQWLRPILPSPRFLTDSVIEADTDGFPSLSPQHVLIDCQLSPHEVQLQYPALWRYFEKGSELGLDKRYLTSRRDPWYRQEQRESAPFLCTYMGRSQHGRQPFRFLWNQSQAVAPNVFLLMYPIGELAIQLSIDPTLYGMVYNLLSALDIYALIYEGRVYGGALHKIEPSELGKVPLLGFEELVKPVKQMTLF